MMLFLLRALPTLLLLLAGTAFAETWPSRPIRMVVLSAGGTGITARSSASPDSFRKAPRSSSSAAAWAGCTRRFAAG